MGIFSKEETKDQLEEKRDRLIIESEIASTEQSITERKSTIRELKHRYGRNWKNILGLKGHIDLSTLQSFLGGMKKGLSKMGRTTTNPRLDPRPRRIE